MITISQQKNQQTSLRDNSNVFGKTQKSNFLEVDIQHLENLQNLQIDLQFLPGRMKIEKIQNAFW